MSPPRHPRRTSLNGGINTSSNGTSQNIPAESKSSWQRLAGAASAIMNAVMFESQDAAPHIAAYKVSSKRRAAQVGFAVLVCCLASGIICGYAALKPVLIAEGVYRELCSSNDKANSVLKLFRIRNDVAEVPCAEQDLRLNLFFVMASIVGNTSTLFAGATLDRFGRHTCYLISAVLLAIGCTTMASSFTFPRFNGYIIANLFLALGGTFLFVSSFQLANAFPKHSGIVMALVTGAFDASAAVFLFYRMAYDASGGAFSPSRFFFGYLIVPLLILIAEFTFMPLHTYHTTPELEQKIEQAKDSTRDVHDSDGEISSDGELRRVRSLRAERRSAKLEQIEDLLGNAEERQERADMIEIHQNNSGVWGVLHDVPFHRQMMTPWFILILVLTVLQMLRMNYFIATVRAQYRYMLNSEDAAQAINHFFDAALPAAGVVSTPFIGLLLNNLSVTTVLSVLTVFIVVIGVLNCLPYVWAGYITVIAFVFFRPLYYSAVSDYATKVFGFATFGRIYGTIMCLSGLANFIQPGLDALTHGPLGGNPVPVNIFMAVSGVLLGVALTGFVAAKSKGIREEWAQGNREDERTRLLSREDEGYGS
ncbi:major facilitator superfamily domain-containing protein [Xylogone sp. PMI_703]|nr:major facilitator superfamily domain-containing protein [Xylogone sp. PMI_703]